MARLLWCFTFLCASAFPSSAQQSSTPVPVQQTSPEQKAADARPAVEQTLLVFYRPKRFIGSGLTPSIYLNGEQLARLDNGRYFSIYVKPGKYKIESSMKKHAPVDLEVRSGEPIYLEMVLLAGNWRGGGRMIPAAAEEAQAEVRKLKPLDKQWIFNKNIVFDTK